MLLTSQDNCLEPYNSVELSHNSSDLTSIDSFLWKICKIWSNCIMFKLKGYQYYKI